MKPTTRALLLAVPASFAFHPDAVPQRRPGLLPLRSPPPVSSTELQKPKTSLLPLSVLMCVPVAWGTYGVSVKALYSFGSPPPELAFGFMVYVVSSSFLGLLYAAQPPPAEEPSASAAAAGFELGGYLFVAALLQLFGLGMTTATRGAFIVQLTTVIVPLMDAARRPALRRTPAAHPPSVSSGRLQRARRNLCASSKRLNVTKA